MRKKGLVKRRKLGKSYVYSLTKKGVDLNET
jgi:predicted transcriptional regulator